MCKCTDPGCYNCLMCSLQTTLKRAAKRAKKHKPTYKPQAKKKKKEPPAKCDLCRRRLIPGDPGDVCMTCRYKMDNDSR